MMFRGSSTPPSINCPGILSVSETVFIVIYRHYKLSSSYLLAAAADHNKQSLPQKERRERGILQYFRLTALNNMLILNLFEFKIERSIMFL